jgi:hypothetical protein
MIRLRLSSLVLLTGLVACSSDAKGTWTLSQANAVVTADNHIAVDVIYINEGDEAWEGSRCVIIDWQKGGVQSREDVRAGKPPSSPVEIVETERFCNGGNNSLRAGDRDLFHVVSVRSRDVLAGSTVVVVAQDVKGTPDDDRVTLPSP